MGPPGKAPRGDSDLRVSGDTEESEERDYEERAVRQEETRRGYQLTVQEERWSHHVKCLGEVPAPPRDQEWTTGLGGLEAAGDPDESYLKSVLGQKPDWSRRKTEGRGGNGD